MSGLPSSSPQEPASTLPVVATAASTDALEQARRALLEAGIAPEAMTLRVSDDEAGPSRGNFAIGNGRTAGDSVVSLGGVATYPENFSDPDFQGTCQLLVFARDVGERDAVLRVLASTPEVSARGGL